MDIDIEEISLANGPVQESPSHTRGKRKAASKPAVKEEDSDEEVLPRVSSLGPRNHAILNLALDATLLTI